MKFLELDLTAYGGFTDAQLSFRSKRGNLHVIYGQNEAGKSTTLRAIRGALFGISPRTRDDYLHGGKGLRIGLVLESHGRELQIVRRKGRKHTLMDADGTALEESVVERALGGVGAELFQSAFGLNHETLRTGARALLEGSGDVGESLFGAGLSLLRVHQTLHQLREQAEALFTPLGRSGKLINAALAEYKKAKQQVQAESTSAQAYLVQQEALKDACRERDELEGARLELTERRLRLERNMATLPKLARRDQYLAVLERLAQVPDIGPETSSLRRKAFAELETAQRQLETLRSSAERLRERLGQLSDFGSVLRMSEEEVESLKYQLGRARAAIVDEPKLMGRQRALVEKIRATLEQIRPGHPVAEVERLRVSPVLLERVKRLARQHDRLLAQEQQAGKNSRAAEHRVERIQEELASLPQRSGAGHLAETVRQGQAATLLAHKLEADRVQASVLRAELGSGFAALGHVASGVAWETLLTTPLPLRADVEELRARQSEVSSVVERAEQELQRCEQARERVAHEISREGAALGDSTVETLQSLRRARDTAWDAFLAGLDEPLLRVALADAVSSAQRTADQAADGLWQQADRVARLRALQEEQSAAVATCQRAATERERATAELAGLEARYAKLWPPVVLPSSPSAMLEWLTAVAALRTIAAKLQELLAYTEPAARDVDAARSALKEQLTAATRQPPGDIDLAELLRRSTELLAKEEEQRARRSDLEGQLRSVQVAQGEQALELGQLKEERSAWAASWREATEGFAGAGADTEDVLVLLDEYATLFSTVDEERTMSARIDAIRRDNEELRRSASELARNYLPAVQALPWTECAAALIDARSRATMESAERQRLTDELTSIDAKISDTTAARDSAQGQLTGLMKAAGVQSVMALEGVERQAQERVETLQRLRELEEELIEQNGGQTIAALQKETAGLDADRLRAQQLGLEQEVKELGESLSAAMSQVARCELGAQRLGQGAATANEEAQLRLQKVRTLVEQYVRVHLASTILAEEIERYRQEHQGPVLARVNELFPRLSGGNYQGVRTGFDDQDNQLLVCVREDGVEVGVPDLSDGARDQLYLALRLATLQRHADVNEPLPLILDDVLIHFDDDRALAALQALGEFSRNNQVLFFTHHRRLVELARLAVPADCLVEHEMSAVAPRSSAQPQRS